MNGMAGVPTLTMRWTATRDIPELAITAGQEHTVVLTPQTATTTFCALYGVLAREGALVESGPGSPAGDVSMFFRALDQQLTREAA